MSHVGTVIHSHFCWLPGFVGAEIPLVAGWIFTSSFFVGDIFVFFPSGDFFKLLDTQPQEGPLGAWPASPLEAQAV